MSCSCHTTSLRVFIQSLTDLRLFDPAIATTRAIQPRYTRAVALRSQFILTRPYTATTALGFPRRVSPRQFSRELPSQLSATRQASEATQNKQTDDGTVNQPSAKALKASPRKYDEAKRKGAVLDLSPESIDSLVANLEESPPSELLPRNLKFGPAVYDELEVDRKRPKESKREKRMKKLRESFRQKRIEGLKKRNEQLKKLRGLSKDQRREHWRIQKAALKLKFPEGWKPRKRLSPDAVEGIRALHAQFPAHYTTEVLADEFLVSPEAIRRILKGNWQPSPEQEEERQRRWFGRGKNIWSQMAAIGRKPPRKWRREGIVRDPIWNVKKGPRTQPPRQRKPRYSDMDADPVFEAKFNIGSAEDSGERPIIDANEEFHRKMRMKREPNRRFNKGPTRKFDRNPDRKFDEKPSRKFDESPGRKLDEKPSMTFDESPGRKLDENPKRELDENPSRKFDESPGWKLDENPNRTFDESPATNLDKNLSRTFDESPSRKLDETPKRKSDETPRRKFDRMSNRRKLDKMSSKKSNSDSNRKSNKGFNRNSKKETKKVPDRDAFDQAFDKRFEPGSNRGFSRKSYF